MLSPLLSIELLYNQLLPNHFCFYRYKHFLAHLYQIFKGFYLPAIRYTFANKQKWHPLNKEKMPYSYLSITI